MAIFQKELGAKPSSVEKALITKVNVDGNRKG
jgi:hypothetical protein